MGGKTQQRVAGNVKPTSSGRIRELMMNKQQGLGNIITFSTLSNNPPIVSQSSSPKKTQNEKKSAQQQSSGESEPCVSIQNDVDTTSNSVERDTPTKTTLIVKRVGNRDYFTRVQVPNNSVGSSVSIDKPGVHHFDPNSCKSSEEEKPELCDHNDDNINIFEDRQDEFENVDTTCSNDPTYDFDSLLDELNKIQINCLKINQSAVSLNDLSENQIVQEQELIRLLRTLVKDFKEDLSIEEWDLIVQSNYKWTSLIIKTDELLNNTGWTLFCINVFKFIHELILLAKEWSQLDIDDNVMPIIRFLIQEFNNFHSSEVYKELILLFFSFLSDEINQTSTFTEDAISIVQALANIILEVDPKTIICNDEIKRLLNYDTVEFDPCFKTPENHRFCKIDPEIKFKSFLPICNLMKSNHRIIVVTAHSILSKVMVNIGEKERDIQSESNEDLESISLMPPEPLMAILTSKDSIMTALLSDYKVGDISVTIEPNTDSYTCTLSYLFVWDLIIQFIVSMDKEDGHRLIHCLKKLGFISRLLDNIFILLPPLGEKDSIRFGLKEQYNCKGQKSLVPQTETWYLMEYLKSPLRTTVVRPKNEIELTALHVYFSIALHMPVTVRKWYNNNSNKRLSNLVNEYTVKHISQVICSLEMETVQGKCQERAIKDKSNNLYIKARPLAREVHAVYTRDEFKMELTIKLPINYPLSSVQIDGGKRVAVTDLKWRSWLLQLTTFLSHQNGPILDGIDLWRRNIDKRFEGIEKCMICFSILHSNYQLPRRRCVTCTKMFHNICLYKWFDSSANTTCPHCRSIW